MNDREEIARRALRIGLKTALALVGDREQASDIAQEVALDALRGVKQVREPAAFDGWVRKIAVRHAMRALKQRGADLGQLAFPSEDVLLSIAAPALDHDLLIAARASLNTAMSTLPERQRIALVLRYVHDLTDREIADALGCRRGTANALLSRGRAALQQSAALRDLASAMEMT